MIQKLQKLLDGMNNFDFDFDGTDIALGLIGFTILFLWMKFSHLLRGILGPRLNISLRAVTNAIAATADKPYLTETDDGHYSISPEDGLKVCLI